MYFLWSLLASILIFMVIQYNEYKKHTKTYNLYALSNLITFVIIYIIITILFYLVFSKGASVNLLQKGGTNISNTFTIDPVILRKIPDSLYTGFTPYDE